MLAQLLEMHVATQKSALHTRCLSNCTFRWQLDPAEDDAVAIKSNCLQVVNFELEKMGWGDV